MYIVPKKGIFHDLENPWYYTATVCRLICVPKNPIFKYPRPITAHKMCYSCSQQRKKNNKVRHTLCVDYYLHTVCKYCI